MLNNRFLYTALTSALAIFFQAGALAQSADQSKTIAPAQSTDRLQTLKEVDALKTEFFEKEHRFLLPSTEDRTKYAKFLQRPYSGLIRLFPLGLYSDALLIPGGGSFYSFALSSYDGAPNIEFRPPPTEKYDPRPPIEACEFGTFPNGFIVAIGDVPLDEVTLTSDVIKFLAAYSPPSTVAERRAAHIRYADGIEENGYEYKKHVPVIVNCTYALRSIVYGGPGSSDVLAIFRVVRKDDDGSVVVLWNILEKFPTPSPPLR